MTQAAGGAFPPTRPSVVRDLGSEDPARRAAAFDALARSYWRPVYVYVRLRWRHPPADAQDLTQEFFTRAFERDYLSRYDPGKARFRTFVRTCLDGFLANAGKAAARLKRGGGFIVSSIDFARFDEDLAAHARSDEPDPERWFHREWVRGLFADALDRLRARCDGGDHPRAFALFMRYDVEGDADPARPSYAVLAHDAGLRVTDVTNELAWAWRAFRDSVLEQLREVCATDEEFRAEARDLLGVDVP
jgi:RNA polymerase sigma factor (sigma-70 family)